MIVTAHLVIANGIARIGLRLHVLSPVRTVRILASEKEIEGVLGVLLHGLVAKGTEHHFFTSAKSSSSLAHFIIHSISLIKMGSLWQ
jgi:hypothetical protein